MKQQQVALCVAVLITAPPVLAAAPDTGWAGAIGMILLVGLVLVCAVTGLIGYGIGHSSQYRPLFAVAGVVSPIVVLFLMLWRSDRKDNEEYAALVEANQAVIRVAQTYIDATCAELQGRETRAVDLERSLQRRVISGWRGLDVQPSDMDWPLPMERVALAFRSDYQRDLRFLRFEQPYFERHPPVHISKQFDYMEHIDKNGQLYALASAAHWRTLRPRLDDEAVEEISRNSGLNGRADHFIGLHLRKSLAPYGLEVTEVSTREDRGHWTARLRVKVFDTASGEGLVVIERLLPILIDALGNRTGGVRLCARPGHQPIAEDRKFDWLGYLAREVSTDRKH